MLLVLYGYKFLHKNNKHENAISECSSSNNMIENIHSENYSSIGSEYIESVKFIRSEIKAVTDTKKYKNADVNEKIELIDPVLKKLYDNGYISDYEYDFDRPSPNVSYYYSIGNGGGGVIFF